MREATLADARKANWGPSVTGVLEERSKPGLDVWKVEQAIKVALPMAAQAAEADIMAEVKRQSEAYRDWSAEFGTQVHHCISQMLKEHGYSYPATGMLLGVEEVAQAFLDWMGPNGVQVTESEVPFYSSLGYGGTIDLLGTYYGEPFIGDIKTQSHTDVAGKNGPRYYSPEWPLQLAGYAVGIEQPHLKRLSFVLSRVKPELITVQEWPEPDRWDRAWHHLWNHWKLVHSWGEESFIDETGEEQ